MAKTEARTSMTWQHPEIGGRIAASKRKGCVLWLQNIQPSVLISDLSAFREHVADLGLLTLTLNANGSEIGERTLDLVLQKYLQKVERRVGLDAETLRLAEWLHRTHESTDRGHLGRLRADTIGRLWTRLSQIAPAVLVAVDLANARPGDIEVVRHLARFVFADPIEALTPETGSSQHALGALVVVGSDGETLGESAVFERIDYREVSEAAIRAFLEKEDVVQRFMETSGGDITRLESLVTHLPQTAEHLQLHRYRQLPAHEQALIEVLAVAGEPVAADRVQHAVAFLQQSEYFARSVRHLGEAGFVQRSIGVGDILIRLTDVDFARALRDALPESRRVELHLALANSERIANEDAPNIAFLARHFIAAGAVNEGLNYGQRALKKLVAEQLFDEALVLVDGVLALAIDGSDEQQELQLVAAHAATGAGHHQQALEHLENALDSAATDDRPGITLELGRTLNRLSQFDASLERFEEVRLSTQDTRLLQNARIGRGEALYALGRHDTLIDDLENLVAMLIESADGTYEGDSTLVKARNTLGKVAIFRANYAQARSLFNANRKLASRWGWDEEVARAQANLGVVALQEREFGDALLLLNEALNSSGLRSSLPRAYCLVNLATVHQRQRNFGEALEACLEALRSSKTAGDDVAYSVAAHNLATIYQDLGAFERGRTIIDHLHERYEPQHRTLTSRWNRLVHGYLYLDEGEYERAVSIFEELVDLDAIQTVLYGPEASLRLAQAHMELGQDARARDIVRRFSVGEGNGDRELLEALLTLQEAEFDLLDEKFESAYEKAVDARQRLTRLGSQNDPARAALVLADALAGLGRTAEVSNVLTDALDDVLAFSRHVPEAFRDGFFGKPYHRAIVERLHALDAAVPAEIESALCEPLAAANTDSCPQQVSEWQQRYGDIIGDDPKLHHIFRVIDRVAKSDATVLVYGESGTGKELISGAVHAQSNRSRKPFVKVNCAAFVENLLLSELFGHEKGAFTGAVTQKVGRFEMADGGTIFLDEIGDISPNTQVALLRVLQEGTFERVGGGETLQVDVRVVCATNRNLEDLVKRGEFRLDLYYRLKGVVIETPALRERRQDIPALITHFAERFAQGAPKTFSHDVLRFLAGYSWPGNIRELQNFVKSVLLFVEGGTVQMNHVEDFREFFVSGEFSNDLPELDLSSPQPGRIETPHVVAVEHAGQSPEDALIEKIVFEGLSLNDLKKRLEVESIKRALLEAEGNVTRAAEMLQMKRPRLSQIINGNDELTDLKSKLVG